MAIRHLSRAVVISISIALFAGVAAAEGTRTWQQSTFDELSKGTSNGVALRSTGGLELAPSFKSLVTTPSSYIWAVAAGNNGELFAAAGSPARVYFVTADGKAAPVAQPLQHDIMTGTKDDGTKDENTCKDWTVGDASAKAMLGHADRLGRNEGLNSWTAIHPSQGCGLAELAPTGGAGLVYCFATN